MMTIEQIIWLAGFVDGEGYIGIAKHGTRCYQTTIRIATTHFETMEYVARLLDCKLFSHRSSKAKPQWRTCHAVAVYDRKAENLCRILLPYLITKKAQAANLLEYRKTIRIGNNQSIPLSLRAEWRQKQKEFWLISKFFNRRGLEVKCA